MIDGEEAIFGGMIGGKKSFNGNESLVLEIFRWEIQGKNFGWDIFDGKW